MLKAISCRIESPIRIDFTACFGNNPGSSNFKLKVAVARRFMPNVKVIILLSAMCLVGGGRAFGACVGTSTHICVTHNGTAFVVNGVVRGALNFVVGTTYEFEMTSGNFSFHPFVLTTSANGGFGSPALGSSDGVQGPNPATAVGQIIRFTPVRAGRVFYQCSAHLSMGGPIDVTVAGPSISGLSDKIIHMNTSTGSLPFTIGDNSGTPVTDLTVSALSSNVVLVPTNNIVFGGSDSNRTVTVTPTVDQSGTSRISVVVANPSGTAVTNSFLLTVVPLTLAILRGDANTNVLQFNALSNRTYSLESRDSLSEGSFSGVPIPSAPANRVVRITNDVRGVNSRYYRLATPAVP
jgi:hypothetical protein